MRLGDGVLCLPPLLTEVVQTLMEEREGREEEGGGRQLSCSGEMRKIGLNWWQVMIGATAAVHRSFNQGYGVTTKDSSLRAMH